MFRPLIPAIALIVLALATATRAEPPSSDASDARALFTQLDANQDGLIATDEVPSERKALFQRLVRIGDKNDDAKLDATEFAAALKGGHDGDAAPPKRKRPDAADSAARPAPGKFFERLDANGDGKITLDEVPEPGRERFEKLIERVDKDGDGAVTLREFAQARPSGPDPARAGEIFNRMDQNGDGKVTADEVPAERRPMVTRLIQRGDKDGDEALSRQELSAAFARGPRPQPPDEKPNRKRPPSDRAARPQGIFGALDADRDGKLSSGEIADASQAILKLDKNGDGTVSAREVLAGRAAKRKKKK